MAKLQILIPKARTCLEIETDNISDYAYKRIFEAGLKYYLTRRMSRLSGISNLSGPERLHAQALALELAQSNLERLYNTVAPRHKFPPNENPKNSACQTGKNVV
jgi:transposase